MASDDLVSMSSVAGENTDLFPSIASYDFLGFEFGSRSYAEQLREAAKSTTQFCAVTVEIVTLKEMKVVWIEHDFSFMGGSLGCAEGEKITLGFELAYQRQMPVVVVCQSGGARMQEGTLSLMQMAKVSVAVAALKRRRIPFISVCKEPCYGGVSASYAMQGDVRIGLADARIGFAGPNVILNTVYKMNQTQYDAECPPNFQSAEFLKENGQLDMVVEDVSELKSVCERILYILYKSRLDRERSCLEGAGRESADREEVVGVYEPESHEDHMTARSADRLCASEILREVFDMYIGLEGDGRIGTDTALRGGIALFENQPCVVLSNWKGADCNYGMASPNGYRLALRLMLLAEHFQIPLFSLVDTVGAYPSFHSEKIGQSEALASNLLVMAGLRVPLVSLVVGVGGSGGALAIAMGNSVGMMERAYYAVISPEGAASILGRYKDSDEKAKKFGKDAAELARRQHIFAYQLKKLGVIDYVIPESREGVNHKLEMEKIRECFSGVLKGLSKLSPDELVRQRYNKFRKMGKFKIVSDEEISTLKLSFRSANKSARARVVHLGPQSKTLHFVADVTMNGAYSTYLGRCPFKVMKPCNLDSEAYWGERARTLRSSTNAKRILDEQGPEALSEWVLNHGRVLVTDTTMRDAHQSLLSTRVRTLDLLGAAEETSIVLHDAFSLEVWGGATFDVCYRFLYEDPWNRLRLLRQKIPNILFQMLIRGSNAVGYKNYADNVVERFVELAAKNGIDVFRIFDCFNDVSQMRVCIGAVRRARKVAEVCICFTGDFLSSDESIYTLDYYKQLARDVTNAGAHIICIKDMAGLVRPQMAKPLVDIIKSVSPLPIHFHTHNTSSASFATCLNMAEHGCHIIDLAISSMADTTSQPSLNAFLASMDHQPRDTGISYLNLERLDQYWAQTRSMYQQFESGLKCGTARVYEHQIPGGQYSNLYAQCLSLNMMDKWNQVLDTYRDVNKLFGNIIKVTPSSKCVGDMALYLIKNGLTCNDVLTRGDQIDFPESVVQLFSGELGFPHHGFPFHVSSKILKGTPPSKAQHIPPVDFSSERLGLESKYGPEITDEDVVSYILYPKTFDAFMTHRAKFGWKINWLHSQVFFFGMNIGETIPLDYPEDNQNLSKISPHLLTLKRIGPLTKQKEHVFEFELDAQVRKVGIIDQAVAASDVKLPKADPSDPKHIPSPLPGVIEHLFVGLNSEVKKKAPIATISAMKMEVQVVSPFDGIVLDIPVKVGVKVDVGSLIAIVEPRKSALSPYP